MKRYAALGLLLCAGHAAAYFTLAADPPPPFELPVTGPAASPTLQLDATLPASLRSRVHRTVDDPGTWVGAGAGLRRVRWSASYRGGFHRAVGATQLVGPFQDPAAPPCSGRVAIGQRLLDDGTASPGTIAHLVRRLLAEQLAGQGSFPVGDFLGVEELHLTWAEPALHPEDAEVLAEATRGEYTIGYLRTTAVLRFERVAVPVRLVIVPRLEGERLAVRVAAHARLAFENRVAQWLSDLVGADRLATSMARQQLGQVVIAGLEPPPPVPLPGGGELRFVPCGRQPEVVDGSHAALPFAVAISPLPGQPHHLPPLLPVGPPPLPPASSMTATDGAAAASVAAAAAAGAAPRVALELDLNGLNALLYGAWRDGFLDRQLAAAGLDARFNSDPTVATYLSLRLTSPRLALPPVVTASGEGLRLSAETVLQLVDGTARTTGHAWTAMQLTMAPLAPGAASSALRASLHQLELTCEPRPGVLAPCYPDIVAAMSARTIDFDTALTAALSAILAGIFVDRTLGGDLGGGAELPADLVIRGVTPSLRTAGGAAALRLDLDVELHDRAR